MILNTPMPPSQFGFDPCSVICHMFNQFNLCVNAFYIKLHPHDGNGNTMGSNVFNAHYIIISTKLFRFTNILHGDLYAYYWL